MFEQKYRDYEPIALSPSAPLPSVLRASPYERRRRCGSACSSITGWACLVLVVAPFLFFLFARPSSAPIRTSTEPPSRVPTLRLAQLNQEYDPAREGFGVGSASLNGYRDDLRQAYEGLFGSEHGGGAVDLVRHSTATAGSKTHSSADELAPLWPTTRCALDPTCPLSSASVPMDLYMTAAEVDPEPPSVPSWREHNPDLDLNLFADADVLEWIEARFPVGTIMHDFSALPINILQFDLFRLLVLYARGGVYTDADTYAIKAVEHWGTGAVDLTDQQLLVDDEGEQLNVLRSPPALVVGVEWSGRTETNLLNPLFSRSVGVVQWTFGATKGHPVVLDAIRRVVRHSHQVMGTPDPSGPATGPLHFDPDSDRMVLEWSGPAVLSDALARYTRTRWGVSLESLGRFDHPVRVGDVLLLPIGALNARTSTFLKLVDWALGRNRTPLTDREDCVLHMHAASWWGKKVRHQAEERL